MLKEQWSGLFKNLLHDIGRSQEIRLSSELKSSLYTLKQMIDYIARDRSHRDDVIKTIIAQNHPIFNQLADATGTEYRVFL